MFRNLKFLRQLMHLYGFKKGSLLFFNFKTRKSSEVKVPEISNSIYLRKGTSDNAAFRQVFVHKEYDINFGKHPKVIIDGGANIGLFTIFMKNKYPQAKIICIEPDPENFEVLKKNVGGYPDVYCENAGLWNKEIMLSIHDKYDMGKWGMVVEENEEGIVKAISINYLIKKYDLERIDILKLDIETSEKILFKDNYENWLKRTKMMVVELHDEIEEGCSKPFFEAINKTYNKYRYSFSGENTVIVNNDLD